MHPILDPTTVTQVLTGALIGFAVSIVIRTVRGFALLVLACLLLAVIADCAVDGWIGELRWLQFGVSRLVLSSSWIAGFAVGRLLADLVFAVL